MGFHNARLPDDVERGAQGGPGFKTTVVTLKSGSEKRNQDWSQSRGSWDLSYGIQSKTDFMLVLRFFYARKGRAFGFRFKDWSDFEADRQVFATADGVDLTFQLLNTYNDGNGYSYNRIITKPVQGTVSIWRNNVLLTETTDYSINYNTGVVTFVAPGTNGHTIEWEGEFDVPVRFDRDNFDITLQHFDAGAIPSFQVLELRPEDAV
jgi:uncharacterized protein (TIGR02217 family)